MGTHKRRQHTPPTHSPPGDKGCYCSAAGSMYKHPLPVPLPDHATQRTKSATKLQLIQMANSNNNSDNILMRRTPTPIKTHHPPSTGPAPDHRPRWRRCLRHSSSLCHYQRYHRRWTNSFTAALGPCCATTRTVKEKRQEPTLTLSGQTQGI